MNTLHTYDELETEYSKKWVQENPTQFAESVLSFLKLHPDDCWSLSINQTKGFFTFVAKIKEEK